MLELGLPRGTEKQPLLDTGTLHPWLKMEMLIDIIQHLSKDQVLEHRCDPKVRADASSVLKDLSKASRSQSRSKHMEDSVDVEP